MEKPLHVVTGNFVLVAIILHWLLIDGDIGVARHDSPKGVREVGRHFLVHFFEDSESDTEPDRLDIFDMKGEISAFLRCRMLVYTLERPQRSHHLCGQS